MKAKLNAAWIGLPAGTELIILRTIPWEHGNNCHIVERADGKPFPQTGATTVPCDPILVDIIIPPR